MTEFDFTGLCGSEAEKVSRAIERRENFYGYIPSDGLDFIMRNYVRLAERGVLEAAWLDAYVHASHFERYGLEAIRSVFDACDRKALLSIKPLGEFANVPGGRLTVFRGCAGPVHAMGMSWIPSLDKAIWYAAHHAEHYNLANPAVYVATVAVADIYCRLDHYDIDLIVCPENAWRIDVPALEFRLDRVR
ncbi:hypothetical protein [Brucella anthropi]|uniref:hypothetical protein n=1 Tax=Brucella anthropi TaxID=529 RepID=UPI00124E2BC6|nr:hypothetical protein [Brucella anthropi]KAB2737442.1 hypothetical protein F9K89_09100 [Brucella anthropi]